MHKSIKRMSVEVLRTPPLVDPESSPENAAEKNEKGIKVAFLMITQDNTQATHNTTAPCNNCVAD